MNHKNQELLDKIEKMLEYDSTSFDCDLRHLLQHHNDKRNKEIKKEIVRNLEDTSLADLKQYATGELVFHTGFFRWEDGSIRRFREPEPSIYEDPPIDNEMFRRARDAKQVDPAFDY